MKKRLIILIVLALLALVAYKLILAPHRDGLAARYLEHEVSWTQVEQLRSVLSLTGSKEELGDRALVDRILTGYIILDEAKALGISVSESEVAQKLTELPLPDGAESLQEYLSVLGGSLQDWLELVREEARSAMLLDRLREALTRDYCAEHGISPDLDQLPEEVSRAVNERIESLLESRRSEIEYYF